MKTNTNKLNRSRDEQDQLLEDMEYLDFVFSKDNQLEQNQFLENMEYIDFVFAQQMDTGKNKLLNDLLDL